MAKEKSKTKFDLVFWITSHPWLKIISLALAILVWFYVSGVIGRNY